MIRTLCLLLAISSPGPLLAADGNAAPTAAADAALGRGDYETAARLLRPLAAAGNPVARSRLAALYQRGAGVERNLEKAVALYLAAASDGDADAQFNLGNMYLMGEGVPQDDAWALTFYKLASEQGHALAIAHACRKELAHDWSSSWTRER